jgi:Na+/proline symporter
MDVNSMLQWIVSALYGSYVVSNILKWYWWRLNGAGFFWGMVAGILPALVLPRFFVGTLDLYYFPIILGLSALGAIIGTYSAPPTDDATLKSFYRSVRPWGFWKPVREMVIAETPDFKANTAFGRDMLNVALGVVVQTGLIAFPIYLVLMNATGMAVTAVIIAFAGFALKRSWWDRLHELDEPST